MRYHHPLAAAAPREPEHRIPGCAAAAPRKHPSRAEYSCFATFPKVAQLEKWVSRERNTHFSCALRGTPQPFGCCAGFALADSATAGWLRASLAAWLGGTRRRVRGGQRKGRWAAVPIDPCPSLLSRPPAASIPHSVNESAQIRFAEHAAPWSPIAALTRLPARVERGVAVLENIQRVARHRIGASLPSS